MLCGHYTRLHSKIQGFYICAASQQLDPHTTCDRCVGVQLPRPLLGSCGSELWKCVILSHCGEKFSPHCSDQEVQDSDHGDADEHVQGPLEHRALHVEAPGTVTDGLCGVLSV